MLTINRRGVCTVQLIYLQQMALLLVRMKRTELRVTAKQKRAAEAKEGPPSGGGAATSGNGDSSADGAGPKTD